MREERLVEREMEGRIEWEKVRVSKRLLGPCWWDLEIGGVNFSRTGSPKWLA